MTKPAYYNEVDKFAAQWLRNLIAAGHIAAGDVDERPIQDIKPYELRPYAQCHFFAGIGVWSYALRRAGWQDAKAVWTGSCPCQPFSKAGSGLGFADERHLWPYWFHLIEECRPWRIFGEQVADRRADEWVDLVQDDLEAVDYAFGAVAFPASGVGAPTIRDRLYWMGHTDRPGLQACEPAPVVTAWGRGEGRTAKQPGRAPLETGARSGGRKVAGAWADADWLRGTDGRWRPVSPGSFPLAHGPTTRVGRLRAYGNALNAEAATAFIVASM